MQNAAKKNHIENKRIADQIIMRSRGGSAISSSFQSSNLDEEASGRKRVNGPISSVRNALEHPNTRENSLETRKIQVLNEAPAGKASFIPKKRDASYSFSHANPVEELDDLINKNPRVGPKINPPNLFQTPHSIQTNMEIFFGMNKGPKRGISRQFELGGEAGQELLSKRQPRKGRAEPNCFEENLRKFFGIDDSPDPNSARNKNNQRSHPLSEEFPLLNVKENIPINIFQKIDKMPAGFSNRQNYRGNGIERKIGPSQMRERAMIDRKHQEVDDYEQRMNYIGQRT